MRRKGTVQVGISAAPRRPEPLPYLAIFCLRVGTLPRLIASRCMTEPILRSECAASWPQNLANWHFCTHSCGWMWSLQSNPVLIKNGRGRTHDASHAQCRRSDGRRTGLAYLGVSRVHLRYDSEGPSGAARRAWFDPGYLGRIDDHADGPDGRARVRTLSVNRFIFIPAVVMHLLLAI